MGIETHNHAQPDFFNEQGEVIAPAETPSQVFKRLFGWNPEPYGLLTDAEIQNFIRRYEKSPRNEVNMVLAGLAREQDAELDYRQR
jgi:hypothetical protein